MTRLRPEAGSPDGVRQHERQGWRLDNGDCHDLYRNRLSQTLLSTGRRCVTRIVAGENIVVYLRGDVVPVLWQRAGRDQRGVGGAIVDGIAESYRLFIAMIITDS